MLTDEQRTAALDVMRKIWAKPSADDEEAVVVAAGLLAERYGISPDDARAEAMMLGEQEGPPDRAARRFADKPCCRR